MNSNRSLRRERYAIAIAAVLALLAIVATASFVGLRQQLSRTWGDEGTYLAMAASLARDLDLTFDRPDRDWALAQKPVTALILQRDGEQLAYSKPLLYPMVGAPLVAFFGPLGLPATNLLLLLCTLWVAWGHLRTVGDREHAAWMLATFLGGSVVLVYVAWSMTEILQLTLVVCGTVLALRPTPRTPSKRMRLLGSGALGGILLGALISLRLPHLLLAVAPVASLLLTKRYRRAGIVGTATLAAWAALVILQLGMQGATDPYRAERTSFDARTGFPITIDKDASKQLAENSAVHRTDISEDRDLQRILYASYYTVVGRHTGILAYFPVALLLVGVLVAPDRRSTPLLLAAVGLTAFYIYWLPGNYFGGSTFLGNRYFFAPLGLLLAAVPRLPRLRWLLIVWVCSAVFAVSAAASVRSYAAIDRGSQNHAYAGAFRLLPYESTAEQMDGQRSFYWEGDFVRLLDPFASTNSVQLTLSAGQPTTEMMVASGRGSTQLFLLATTAGQPATLEIDHGDRLSTFELDAPDDDGQLIVLDLSPRSRRHGYWFNREIDYDTRFLRLRIVGAAPGQEVALRYLSDGRALRHKPVVYVAAGTPPTTAVAGSRQTIVTETRNTGFWPWQAEGPLPVRLGYRIEEVPSGRVVRREFVPIARNLKRMEILVQSLEVTWPQAPGTYRLLVDFHREAAGWFSEQTRSPILDAEVTVLDASEAVVGARQKSGGSCG